MPLPFLPHCALSSSPRRARNPQHGTFRALGTCELASLTVSRGEEGRRKKPPGPKGRAAPGTAASWGRDSRVPRISLRVERLHLNRSSARPQLSRWPPPPRASPAPQTSRGADPRGRVKTGVRWGPGRDPLRPRVASHRHDLTHPARSSQSAEPRAAGPSPSCTLRPGRLRGGAGPGQGGAGDTATAPPP